MRVGNNPYKDKKLESTNYTHHVIIPVFIPNEEAYFKDTFQIFKYCLESLFKTCHSKTYITVVNNGSYIKIVNYLNELYGLQKIHEVIHTENIGKLNAILKGVVGNTINLVTITDADVLFEQNWQQETIKVFNAFPKAGVVGLIPQFKLFESNCSNVLFDTFFSKNVRFTEVLNKNELKQFYESIGWKKNYNISYLEKHLTIKNGKISAIIGSGHVVATYKRELFETITTYINAKMGANSETYLDRLPLKKGLWRLTINGNFAFHMGNVKEPWMEDNLHIISDLDDVCSLTNLKNSKKVSNFHFCIKNRLFPRLFSNKNFRKLYYRYKKLPKKMISNY